MPDKTFFKKNPISRKSILHKKQNYVRANLDLLVELNQKRTEEGLIDIDLDLIERTVNDKSSYSHLNLKISHERQGPAANKNISKVTN